MSKEFCIIPIKTLLLAVVKDFKLKKNYGKDDDLCANYTCTNRISIHANKEKLGNETRCRRWENERNF